MRQGREWQIGRARDFRGGETQATLPELVERNQLLRLENAIINENGSLASTFSTHETILVGATNGVALVRLPGGTYNTYWASGNNLYLSNFSTLYETPIDVHHDGIGSGCTGCFMQGIQMATHFLGKEYAANPNPDTTKNGILNLSDADLILIPGVVSRKLRRYTNRLWVVNSNGSIRFSNNGDATIWDELDLIWLPNHEPAIDFIPVQGGAIVYSQNSIYAMYGSDYTDISFTLIMTDLKLTSGAVCVDNAVYIVSTRGIIAASLNGAALLPHEQENYFKNNFDVFAEAAVAADVVTGCYLQRLKAVYFTWHSTDGADQSLLVYVGKQAYSKINSLLPSSYPYILALNDTYIDGLIGTASGTIAKFNTSTATDKTAYIQTRHEDFESSQPKVFRDITLTVDRIVSHVTIDAYLDHSDTATTIASDITLAKGENTIWLDIPRARTVSFLFTIANSSFVIDEIRMKFRIVGAEK